MTAIVLTDEQADALRAANADSLLTLEPRRLEDGRLILNADVLDDPHFSDPTKPWAQILARQEVIVEEPKEGEPTKIDDITRVAIIDGLAQAKSEIVTLTESDLTERQ